MSQGTIDSLCKFIRDVMKRFRRLHLSFFGGEPLLAFDTVILPILQAVKHYSLIYGTHYEVSFTSNGALLTDKRINTLKQFEVRNFQITIDGDKDLHDKVRFLVMVLGLTIS